MSILAAVDDDDETDVVQRGYELAQAFGEDLVVLNIQPETGSVETAEEVASNAIRLALDDPENVTAAGALGDPAPRILHEAEERNASYIVLGPRKQTPIGKALMGSVSQLVLLNADCTVAFVAGE
ncbi:universal stress protein [Haloplanus aerogenes]|uniref:Nucleotide-binding universal stress UspA family protein n=1 Tax=Haloplanus aerogenes TaxID=660522 RepID=A0A3M0E167_9EURY|nr:universal stress protein [Haloplanus aerogenes]AZH25654.1 universal stress protein [Haloplanus aerogenes]RMB25383.1 nucleotide-binding universal stress UspA family protein [Haloplanus aerogenes]